MTEPENEDKARPKSIKIPDQSTNDLTLSSLGNVSPNELFKRVVINDAKQNNRLSAKFSASDKVNGAHGAAAYSKGPTKMRFIICSLGLMSLAMSQMSRMVINQCIPQMVDPSLQASDKDDTSISAADGSCPWPVDEMVEGVSPTEMPPSESLETTTLSEMSASTPRRPIKGPMTSKPIPLKPIDPYPTSAPTTADPYADDNMQELPDMELIMDKDDQPAAQTDQASERANDTVTPKVADKKVDLDGLREQRFMWTMKDQGVLLGGFYYSYFVFMILGGRMAEVYGAKYVILLSVAGSALINLATPWMARTSFGLLVASRVVLGAIQSGVFPAVYALIAKWLTMSEASIFAPLIKMNLRLGMVFGSLIPGLIPGWPNVFYFTGVVSTIWSIAWIVISTSDPADNRWVSAGELAHINRKKRKPKPEPPASQPDSHEMIEMKETGEEQTKTSSKRKASFKTPWLKIWTAPSVIGLIVVKLTFNYGLDFLAIELPSYLKYVHHATRQQISGITTPMFGIQVFLIVFVGWLAKVSVQRRPLGLSKTAIRKIFQSIASLGLAFFFFLLTFNDCNLLYVTILLQIISFVSMFTAGGETMLPYDLSDEYPATIMSIANSIANISGVTTTTLAVVILGDQGRSYDRWNLLIYLIAGANLIGGLTFILLAKAEPIDFESKSAKKTKAAHVEEAQTVPIPVPKNLDDGLTEIKLSEPTEPEGGTAGAQKAAQAKVQSGTKDESNS